MPLRSGRQLKACERANAGLARRETYGWDGALGRGRRVGRVRRHQGDFGLGFHVPCVVHFRAGKRAYDFEVHVLRGGLRGAHDHAGLQRNRVEAFAVAGPCAGGAQAVVAIIFGRGVGIRGAVAQDFEAGENDGARRTILAAGALAGAGLPCDSQGSSRK